MSDIDTSNMSPEQILDMQKKNCIFCKIIAGEIPSKKLYEDEYCIVVLDINPANEGHCLILPKEHYQIMPQMTEDVIAHLFIIAKKVSHAILQSTYGLSTSIFVANGAAAGQKAPHFMVHVIPRKNEKEFLKIPANQTNPADLEKIKNVLIQKLFDMLGKSPVYDKPEQKVSQDIPLQEMATEEKHDDNNEIDTDMMDDQMQPEPSQSFLHSNSVDLDAIDFFNLQPGTRNPMPPKQENIIEETEKKPQPSEKPKKKMTLDDIQKMLLGEKK